MPLYTRRGLGEYGARHAVNLADHELTFPRIRYSGSPYV